MRSSVKNPALAFNSTFIYSNATTGTSLSSSFFALLLLALIVGVWLSDGQLGRVTVTFFAGVLFSIGSLMTLFTKPIPFAIGLLFFALGAGAASPGGNYGLLGDQLQEEKKESTPSDEQPKSSAEQNAPKDASKEPKRCCWFKVKRRLAYHLLFASVNIGGVRAVDKLILHHSPIGALGGIALSSIFEDVNCENVLSLLNLLFAELSQGRWRNRSLHARIIHVVLLRRSVSAHQKSLSTIRNWSP